MAKKHNKSFVEIKKDNNSDSTIINPLEQYEYIEPPKKIPIKQIALVITIIITITLIFIFFKIIDKKSFKPDETVKSEQTTKIDTYKTTTTEKEQNKNDKITETLVCTSSTIEDNLQIDIKVTTNFHNKKLRSDENLMTIKLLNETAKEQFDNYVTTLQMFSLYLMENSNYEITDYTDDNQFSISIKTTYTKDNKIESNLTYDEDYESVKQKLIELGHSC